MCVSILGARYTFKVETESVCVERNSDVTRFVKILMISVQGLLSIWQNFEPTLVIF